MILVLYIHNWATWHIQLPPGISGTPTVSDMLRPGGPEPVSYCRYTGLLTIYGPFIAGTTLRVIYQTNASLAKLVGVQRYLMYTGCRFKWINEGL